MKKTLLGLAAGGLLSLFVASPASASLKLIVDNATVDAPTGADVTKYVDVYFQETAPLQDEQLQNFFFTAYLKGPGTGPTGIHFGAFNAADQTPAANPHPFVFPGLSVYDGGSTPTSYNVGADSTPNVYTNVTDGMGLVRIPLIIPAGATPGTYAIAVDDNPDTAGEIGNTSFSSHDESTFEGGAVPFTTQDGVLTVNGVPEPATLGLFSVAAVGLLARRRRQA